MTKQIKLIAAAFCLAFAGASFLYHIYTNRLTMGGLLASIHVNIELDKTYSDSFVLINEPYGYNPKIFLPTNTNTLEKIVIHAEITNEFSQGISIELPQEHSGAAVASIDSISIFIGNKLFYFDPSEIAKWEYIINDEYINYTIPVGIYEKSFIKPWINWYGDLNFILKGLIALLTQPHRFIFVYLFLLAAFFISGREVYRALKKYNKVTEIALLILLLVFGFLLRVDNLTRYSSWYDELASAADPTLGANPNIPIISTFKDPGNPPFYYLVLRLWFNVFGWSEATGRLLSVFIGTAAILVLYCFVKSVCGKKYAFISAYLLTIGFSSIGFSHEMRTYILLILLVPLIAKVFVRVLENQTFKDNCLYVVLGVLLVNSHYFGVLFIAGNFFYYLKHNRRILNRKIINFLLVNFLIALSLVPYFYITAFHGALMENNFNTWIPKPGAREYFYAVLLPVIYVTGMILANRIKKHRPIEKKKYLLLDHSFFLIVFVYLTAFLVSLYRPVFHWRYMSICYPLVVIIAAYIMCTDFGVTFSVGFRNFSFKLPLITLVLFFGVSGFINRWGLVGGGNWEVYKESQEYLNLDSKNYAAAAEIIDRRYSEFYDLVTLPGYSRQNYCEVVYINTFHRGIGGIQNDLLKYGLNPDNALLIHTDKGWSPIYKVLLNP